MAGECATVTVTGTGRACAAADSATIRLTCHTERATVADAVADANATVRLVRAAVAERTDCPLATMISLAQDKDARVLEALAGNAAASASVLQVLAESKRGAARSIARRRLGLAG